MTRLTITALKPNGLRRTQLALLQTTRERSNSALQTRPLTTIVATLDRRVTTGMAQLRITHVQSNSNPTTHAPTTTALSRRRTRGMRLGPQQTSSALDN